MSKICPNCGKEVSDDALFCDKCGAELSKVPEGKEAEGHVSGEENGKYRWVYELPMLKSFFLLFEVWKVLALSALAVALFMAIVALFQGNGMDGVIFSVEMGALVLGILAVLSLPAYYIVTKANNGKYTVLFEMDEEGIDHIQIKTDKAKALDLLTIGVGLAGGSRGAVSAGTLSATGGSLYSKFSNVRKIKAVPKNHLIRVNGILIHNMVYADDEHFDWVYRYIVDHCPGAKVSL